MKHYIYVEYSNGQIEHSSAFGSYREALDCMLLYIDLNNPVHKNFWIESE